MRTINYNIITRTIMICFLMIIVSLGYANTEAADTKQGSQPKIIVDTSDLQISKTTKVEIRGEGFKPESQISLLFTTIDKVTTDIEATLKPKPVANQRGEWSTTWDYGRFVKRKLIKPGSYDLFAADEEYNIISETTVTFTSSK